MLNTHTKIREFKLDNIEYLKALYDLMKPRVMSLAIFTCVVGFLIAPYKNVDYLYATLSIIAVALGSGAAGALCFTHQIASRGSKESTPARETKVLAF